MTNFFKQLNTEVEKIRMTDAERSHIKARLLTAMEPRPVPSPYFSFVMPRFAVPVALVLVLTIGVGGTYAAEGALPGDFLYNVKVGISEPIRAALAFSDESKAALHASLAERRLDEAETLAARGTLTPELSAELASNFDAHTAHVESIVTTVEAKDPVVAATISAKFGSKATARANVIALLGKVSRDRDTARESESFAGHVERQGERVAFADRKEEIVDDVRALSAKAAAPAPTEMTMQIMDQGNSEEAHAEIALRLGENVLDILAEAEVRLVDLAPELGATTTARVQLEISTIRERVNAIHVDMGDPQLARKAIRAALQDAAVINAFLEARQKLDDRNESIEEGTTLPLPRLDLW